MFKKNKKMWLLAAVVIGLSIPLISRASNVGSLNTFSSGTVISSADVNANFTAIQTAVNSKQDVVTVSCPSGQAIQVIQANGSGSCAPIPAAGATVGQSLSGNSATALFEATNAGAGAGLEAHNSSTNSYAFGVLGVIDSSTPGGLSAAVRGDNMTTTVNGVGVWGTGGLGVLGDSTNGAGVEGHGPIGVVANSTSSIGTALSIVTGGFQVAGAGVGTSTTAFIHQTTNSNTPGANYSWIENNPFANGNRNALLFVTSNTAPAGSVLDPHPLGVQYNSSAQKWNIFNSDGAAMPIGANFNVLVIVP